MPIVWQISVLNLSQKAFIKGTVLIKSPVPKICFSGIICHLYTVLKSYFTGTYSEKNIIVEINGLDYSIKTDAAGSFSLTTDYQANKIRIFDKEKVEKFEIVQTYPIFFTSHSDTLGVISDIDDTIIVSYTADALRRIATIIFTPPLKRKIIDFTSKLMEFLQNQTQSVYYVSKSENNLFGIISTIISHHKLPEGALFLTPYLKFNELFKKKKGIDFKFSTIEFLILNAGHQKYVLFGDDTQKDMAVYAAIAKKYPEKIARIFIRQTKTVINKQKKQYLEKLKKIFSDTVYFNQNTDLKKEIDILNDLSN